MSLPPSDPRKANCGDVGNPNDEVCFDENLLDLDAGLGDCQVITTRTTPPAFCVLTTTRRGPVGRRNEVVCFIEDLLEREVCSQAA